MSAIAGILYWDGRPIPDAQRERLAAHSWASELGAAATEMPGPGLFFQAQVLRFDCLSAAERQPYLFSHGCVLTWDGRLDCREDLLLALHRNLGQDLSDAALVAAAYRHWGRECLPRLVGDWSLALWDGTTRTLTLARDFMGNRPLYYLELVGGLAWATCLEALAIAFDRHTEPDDEYVAGTLTLESPPDRAPFRGVRELRPAHALIASADRPVTTRRYWSFEPAMVRYRDRRMYADRLRELLTEAVRVRLRSNRTVWSHLSGGWDSSTIVCLAHPLIQHRQVEAPALQPVSLVCSASPESDESFFITAVERWNGLRTLRREYPDPLTFDQLLGRRVPFTSALDTTLEGPAETAGDHIVLSGSIGDLVMTGNRLALLEALHRGELRHFLRLCFVRAKHMNRPLLATVGQLLSSAYVPRLHRLLASVAQRRRARQSPTALTGSAVTFFGLTPELRSLAKPYRTPREEPTENFPLATRELVSGLYGLADRHMFDGSNGRPTVWRTYPYVHRPLLEYLVAAPRLAFWDPNLPRAGMKRAFADILPPENLARTTKTDFIFAQQRTERHHSGALMGTAPHTPSRDWALVKHGYIEATAIDLAVRTAHAASAPILTNRFLATWLPLEAWLRTLHAEADSDLPAASQNRDWHVASQLAQ